MTRRLPTVLAALACLAASPAAAQQVHEGLSAIDLFDAASRAIAAGDTDTALTLYEALGKDPDPELRTEARFRRAMVLVSLGRDREAAILLRAILDEKPDAARVRLELASILARLGDEGGARRELRQVQADSQPPEVAEAVNRFAAALRSSNPYGGSFAFGFAPDTNINRATDARTLDTVIAPLTLSDSARAQSGIGLEVSGQAYLRQAIAPSLNFVPRMSGRGSFYRKSEFDDVSASALAGVEWRIGADRVTPSAGRTWRWFGGDLYATTDAVSVNWLHPLGRRAQLTVSGSAGRADYKSNPLQSGGLYDLSISSEYALGSRSGIGATIGGTRQHSRDPGYATAAGYVSAFAWREAGSTTLFASVTLRRTEGDERLFLFPERRREWFASVSGGATLRALTVHGFAPQLRLGYERNASTVGLYDYDRVTSQIGVTRAF